jgi:hypothetical protein
MPILITIFLLLGVRRAPRAPNHPAEHGIKLSVVMAARLHPKAAERPLSLENIPKGRVKIAESKPNATLF